MYRLHIDFPLGNDQQEAIRISNKIIQFLTEQKYNGLVSLPVNTEMGARLGNDTDRGKKDYLRINENGHAANGKQKIVL